MATVNLCGWETGDSSEAAVTAGTFSVQSTTKRTGGYALQVNPTTTNTGSFSIGGLNTNGTTDATSASIATSYFRFYFQVGTLPASLSELILQIRSSAAAKADVTINSAGNLIMRNSVGGVLGTGSTVLSTGVWYRIEVKCGTGASAPWEIKINGVSEISGTSSAIGSSNASVIHLGKRANLNGNTVNYYYDDFIWSDAAYPGAGQCTVLLPEAVGNYQTWTIGAGSGSNWQNVDELPPDGDTTYLLSPLITNDFETEDVTTSAGAGVTGTVNSVKSLSIVKQNLAGATVRVALRSATTDDITTADYTCTAAYVGISKLYDTDPATSAAWTLGGIDGLEVGAKDTNATDQVRMTWTGVMVDYLPASTVLLPSYDGAFSQGVMVPQMVGF